MTSSKKQRTRASLLDAAWKRLKRGDPAKLEDIAADVGVSRQAVYLHFKSRRGLLLALVAHIDESHGLGERIAAVVSVEDPRDQLEAILVLTAEHQSTIQGVAMAILRLSQTDDAARAAVDDRMGRRRQGLVQVLERLAADNDLGPEWSVDEIADVLWEAGHPSSFQHLVVERGWTVARFRQWLLSLGRSFLRANP